MLKIRMQRVGRINMPAYRVIVTEHTRGPKTGNFVEKVGSYNPKTKERVLNADRIKYWMSVGAKPSGTVHNMLITAGIQSGKKINVLPKKTAVKKDAPAETPAKEQESAVADEHKEETTEPAALDASPEVAEAPQAVGETENTSE
jgi:small subunit ribosomal protein S16